VVRRSIAPPPRVTAHVPICGEENPGVAGLCKKVDPSDSNVASTAVLKFVDRGSGSTYYADYVEAKSLRDVHVLLLLCMRVPWRGEVADLK